MRLLAAVCVPDAFTRKDLEMISKRSQQGRVLSAVVLAAMTTFCVTAQGHGRDDDDDAYLASLIKRGYEITPPGVALNLAGKSRALVGLGSYIVNTSGCLDCHTHRAYAAGGDPFQGQPEMVNAAQFMSGGRTFPPSPFVSANITPDFAGKPAGLSLAEFIKTMRTGHNPKDPPGQLLQIMPWPVVGKKTDHDLRAVYEYLRAIPSLPDNPSPGPEP
jgi:hypothetical protein